MLKHIVTPDMTFTCANEKSMMLFLLWTDFFQRSSDWTGEGYWDTSSTVTDGIGG